ncbi:MAG: hypothetical protein KA311_05525 [Sediminibacterium sp.]|nr:hypothetical protein [Sediminibacterium sp.]
MLKQLSFRLIVFSLFVILVSAACGKGSGGSGGGGVTPTPPAPPTPTEENIVFTYDIDPGSNIYAALGTTQEVKITVTSKMPTAGVITDIVVKKDSDGSVVSSSTLAASTMVPINGMISNLATNVVCTATITLKSATTATNTATKTFKIAKK